jgi:putative protein kinase ArgK-like GTPase of G3E family
MAEIVLKSKARSKRVQAIKSSLVKKTLHRADGKQVRILSIDANSPTFGSDLGMVFRMNVAKAKRENSKVIGKSGSRVSKKT